MNREKKPHWRASKQLQSRARELRRTMTPAEKLLWQHIRYGQLDAQFRRQHAVGPYIVDFFCAIAKLVIEVDGGQHSEQIEANAVRTDKLAKAGFRVLRFWNNEVLREL